MIKTENKVQQEIVMYFNNKYCLKHKEPRFLIMSVPNDSINAIETKRKVNTGLLPGASDLIVITDKSLIWVEVKTETGQQQPNQKEFQDRVEKLGYRYILVRSLQDFVSKINLQ